MSRSEPNEGEILSVIREHYESTCELIRTRERRRERILLVAIMAQFTLIAAGSDRDWLIIIVTSISSNVIDADILSSRIGIIEFILWIGVGIIVHSYYQIDILIGRSYPYIHDLEKSMNCIVNDSNLFGREGSAYLNNYPIFSWWTYIIYKFIVPALFSGIPIYIGEINFYSPNSIIDKLPVLIGSGMCLVSTLLFYMSVFRSR